MKKVFFTCILILWTINNCYISTKFLLTKCIIQHCLHSKIFCFKLPEQQKWWPTGSLIDEKHNRRKFVCNAYQLCFESTMLKFFVFNISLWRQQTGQMKMRCDQTSFFKLLQYQQQCIQRLTFSLYELHQ